jgi:hypothetical protein
LDQRLVTKKSIRDWRAGERRRRGPELVCRRHPRVSPARAMAEHESRAQGSKKANEARGDNARAANSWGSTRGGETREERNGPDRTADAATPRAWRMGHHLQRMALRLLAGRNPGLGPVNHLSLIPVRTPQGESLCEARGRCPLPPITKSTRHPPHRLSIRPLPPPTPRAKPLYDCCTSPKFT